jgi:hypothetical protein
LNILYDLKNRQNDVKDRFLLDVIEGLLGIINNKLR